MIYRFPSKAIKKTVWLPIRKKWFCSFLIILRVICHKAQSHIALIKNLGQIVTRCHHLLASMDSWCNKLAKKSASYKDLVIQNIFEWNYWRQAFSSTESLQVYIHCVVWRLSSACLLCCFLSDWRRSPSRWISALKVFRRDSSRVCP